MTGPGDAGEHAEAGQASLAGVRGPCGRDWTVAGADPPTGRVRTAAARRLRASNIGGMHANGGQTGDRGGAE